MTGFMPSNRELEDALHLHDLHQPSPLPALPPQPPLTHPVTNFDTAFPDQHPTHHRLHPRSSLDFGAMAGANGNKPVPVPGGGPHSRMGNGHGGRGMGFDGPRSPPNNKNTSHVPCKFYRQGACQAGKACPFLHSDEPLTERAPCKYFTKGNCKFGHKCALAHILPDGRIVNLNRNTHLGGHLNLGGRVHPPPHPPGAPGSSLLSMQAHMAPMGQPNYPYQSQQEEFFGAQGPPKSHLDPIPTIDTTFSSHPGSNYGSPPNEGGRLPTSPPQKGLSVMDAPLPASFDSQGISHIARYGPVAASVPTGLGLASPPSSFQEREGSQNAVLRSLHLSAFQEEHERNQALSLASSPPESTGQPMGRRILHSERNKTRTMLSHSVGARPIYPAAVDDWDDDNFAFEEDLLPGSLHDEVLTPKEKMRRYSREQGDQDMNYLSHRLSMSRLGASPNDMKVGSPSRYSSLFAKSRPTANDGAFESGSVPGASPFGHVGSPLRNSSLHPGASPSMRGISRPTSGDVSPFVSPPRHQSSMSILSQQLQRPRIPSRSQEEVPSLSGLGRVPSTGSSGIGGSGVGSGPGANRLTSDSRAVSSSSISRSERIDEEQGLFSMEEEDEDLGLRKPGHKDGTASTTSSTSTGNKRFSGLSWGSGGKASPNLGPIGGQRSGQPSGQGQAQP